MGVLDGIKVLELARVAPAELPGMMLADMGADVLKIETPEEEPPTPDALRRAAFAYVNRNKRSLALNLKAPEGQAIFQKLAATADVIVEGFRPGVMKRLGADYETRPRAQSAHRLLLALRLRPERALPRLSRARHELPLAGAACSP